MQRIHYQTTWLSFLTFGWLWCLLFGGHRWQWVDINSRKVTEHKCSRCKTVRTWYFD